MNWLTQFDGFLWIGDPHASSVTPGKRIDTDYGATVCRKLSQAARICREKNLAPVILGDLFERPVETGPGFTLLLSRLLSVLSEFPVAPWMIAGNHDLAGRKLTGSEALAVIAAAGRVVVADDLHDFGRFVFPGEDGPLTVALWGAPYHCPIPARLESPDADLTILVTHHDLAFASYPGTLPLREIPGVDIVVNGHIHREYPAQQHGRTLWVNPGNITRQSVDYKDYQPAMLSWTPCQGFDKHAVDIVPDSFNLEGLRVEPAAAGVSVKKFESQFAKLLQADQPSQAARTADAAWLKDDLAAVLQEHKVGGAAEQMLWSLFEVVAAKGVAGRN